MKGTIAHGKLVIVKPEEPVKIETIKVGNLVFNKNEVEKALEKLVPISS